MLTVLVGLGLAAGVTTVATAAAAASGTTAVSQHSQPLMLNAEAIYSSLADADATAAQAFLAGGLEPTGLTNRYNDDLRRANTALAEAANEAPAGSVTAKSVTRLSVGVSSYASLVAAARANNRQGYPVGAAYLSEASNLNRTDLLPQAKTMLQSAQTELGGGYTAARATGPVAVLVVLLVVLLAALLVVQRYLSRKTHRTFNVPLVAATGLTVLLCLDVTGTFLTQRYHLGVAEAHGSRPITTVAQARILALQERGDEGLTLVARGSGGAYEADFVAVSKQLDGPNGLLAQAGRQVTGSQQAAIQAASASHRAYLTRHAGIRQLDDGGDYTTAVAQATDPQTSAAFAAVTDQLGKVLAAKKATFTNEIAASRGGLTMLGLLGPVAALIICVLAFAGIRARLEEYR